MKLRLDPWATEYNTAFHAEDIVEDERKNVDATPEYREWQAVSPKAPSATPFEQLLFTDGTRRLEARVLLEDERKQVAFGALGSFGIGVVDCCSRGSRAATFVNLGDLSIKNISRICALSSGHVLPAFVLESKLKHRLGRLEYAIETTSERDADAVVRELQNAMLRAEKALASRLTDAHPAALVVADGPLPRSGYLPNIVGYLKTIHQVPITEEQLAVVRGLEEGQRSPLYLVTGSDKTQQYFEWFLRLRDPRPWLYSLAGIVRLQAYASAQPEERLDEVRALADWLALTLPRFASHQHQDPRAPQQLLPIRALEGELRRHMGDARVVRRRIMSYLSER